mmetsp:Transcript_1020/g.1857  ORF Transcript_1020/g.1857 Transcript_1020/m.1857 type:complete len:81 (-) Transcript_1020:824-1066(-)
MSEVYGRFHLDKVYDLSAYQETLTSDELHVIRGDHSEKSRVYEAEEQEESSGDGGELRFLSKRLVVTNSCLLVFDPLPQF